MQTSIKIPSLLILLIVLFSFACKKQIEPNIIIDADTIFVNDGVKFTVNIDFKVKEEEWKVVETNTSFSNETAGTYRFPAKGIYTIEYTAKRAFGRKISVTKKVVVYALPGKIKNYWANYNEAHGDISLWVKGTRYDGKYYEDSVFYERKYGLASFTECKEVYEPEVFLNVPGGRYKCFLKYKYIDIVTIWVAHADSVFIDGNCEAFNY